MHGDELGAVIGTNVLRHASESTPMISMDLSFRSMRIARHSYVLVDHIEHAIFLAVVRAILDKVIRPDMARPLGAKRRIQDPPASRRRPRLGCFELPLLGDPV
jgi:hypothetical protein